MATSSSEPSGYAKATFTSGFDLPCLSLAIAPLQTAGPGHWAIWVVQAPYPGGYVHSDRPWPEDLTRIWQGWQLLFSTAADAGDGTEVALPDSADNVGSSGSSGSSGSYSVRLMQHLGMRLWEWLVADCIQTSFSQSQGIAMGQGRPLRLRLELREPELVLLPWEIMQPQSGRQPISLSQQILFSRTTSQVDPLMPPRLSSGLKVILVLGQSGEEVPVLQLEREAEILAERLQPSGPGALGGMVVSCVVETLVQPTPTELVDRLEMGGYNVFFYAGHGVPAPDGGQLLVAPGQSMSGTELAQVLTRCQVALAVFNACWGAQPDTEIDPATQRRRSVPRSSLAEVLIHHGVPAVLGMRDTIADDEALTFIESFAQALVSGLPVDQAVAVARQQLLTIYRFNQPAWTLPVLYMHPEFNGILLDSLSPKTELPTMAPANTQVNELRLPLAQVRSLQDPLKVWTLRGGLMRVGRRPENDMVLSEQWVSQQHAEIICRLGVENPLPSYFLRDFSRFGTFVSNGSGWQMIHNQEVMLRSGTRMRFGSTQGQTLEFTVQTLEEGDTHY